MKEPENITTMIELVVGKGQRVAVITMKTARFLDRWMELIRVILARHGCRLDVEEAYCLVTFPEGTYKRELIPRVGGSRFLVVLPDGTELIEAVQRDGSSLLGFNKEEAPDV